MFSHDNKKYPTQYTRLVTYVWANSLYMHYLKLREFQLYLVAFYVYINDIYYDL